MTGERRKIAERGGWVLYERVGKHSGGWMSLLLEADRSTGERKRRYWLGWSTEEQRLAGSDDAKVLGRYNPDVRAWVFETLAVLW